MKIESNKMIVCEFANGVCRKVNSVCFIIALIAVVGCGKENELPTSSVSVVNAIMSFNNDYAERIAVVKLVVDAERIYDPDRQMMIWQGVEVAKGDYRKDGFMINLPNVIDNIKPFDLEMPPKARISNSNVMYANSRFIAYNRDEEQVGNFHYSYFFVDDESLLMVEGGLFYFDRDFTITGSGSDERDSWIITCNFKKGWNFLYIIQGGNSDGIFPVKITTSKPDNMFWSFRANDDYRY